ncbi:MAG: hypothetical protein QI197_01405 [Candidatus Korarchaeota archaeon]|nr:hypothetical protein [Candidatus Korarchaeota archaeon]
MLTWIPLTALAMVLSLVASELFHRTWIPRLVSKGYVSEDVHKPGRPKVPEPAGPAVYLSFAISMMVVSHLAGSVALEGVIASTGLAFLIGLLDDLSPLGPKTKPLLLIVPALLLAVSGEIVPRPYLPILGRARLYYIYWIVLAAIFTVFSNGVNMMDALNGMMPSSVFASTLPLLPVLIALGSHAGLLSLIALYGSLIPYYMRNRYPAKVFGGDSNSLFVGAALASVAAISNTEAFFAISLLPFMVSGFSILVSIGGLLERRDIRVRPVIVEGGVIRANPSKEAPISLIAILTSYEGKVEPRIVKEVVVISLISGLLSCFTFFLLTPR